MTEPTLMNNEAARSPTGEILDQASTTSPTKGTLENNSTTSPPVVPAATDASAPTTDSATTPQAKTQSPASTAPDTYTPFSAPTGYTLDPATIEAATPIFRDLGLDQAGAQRLIDFHAAQMLAAAAGPQDSYAALRTDWQGKVKSDPELSAATSGARTGLDAVKADIGRALAILPPDLTRDFRAAMDLTGAGDHPAFVKAMWKLSAYITEGTHVAGTGPSAHGQTAPGAATRPSAAKALYPNNP